MLNSSHQPLERAGPEPVIARLTRFSALTAADIALLRGLNDWRHDPLDFQLVRDGQPASPRFLVSGWGARVRWLPDGRRQIVGFVLPGDGVGLCRRPRPLATCAVIALTSVQTLDARPVLNVLATLPDSAPLARAMNIAEGMDEAWLLNQIVRLGRLNASERLLHLMLELRFRLAATNPDIETNGLGFPLTQEVLAEATGMSMAHVNRTLRGLRRDGLIELRHGRLTIHDPHSLATNCGYRQPRPGDWIAAAALAVTPVRPGE